MRIRTHTHITGNAELHGRGPRHMPESAPTVSTTVPIRVVMRRYAPNAECRGVPR